MQIPSQMPPVSRRVIRKSEPAQRSVSRSDDKNFDKITLERVGLSPEQSFTMETIGHVAQEVRAATTTGDIQALRDKISAGQYQVDVDSIARRILLVGN